MNSVSSSSSSSFSSPAFKTCIDAYSSARMPPEIPRAGKAPVRLLTGDAYGCGMFAVSEDAASSPGLGVANPSRTTLPLLFWLDITLPHIGPGIGDEPVAVGHFDLRECLLIQFLRFAD